MDLQSIAAIIFIFLMIIFLIKKKKKIQIQNLATNWLYFALYKTKFGIKFMDKFSKKFPKALKLLSYLSVGLGFIGMALITFFLIYNLYKLILIPTAEAAVVPVLPFKLKGAFYVPFFYWIISIFIIAIVHEFSHGIFARLHNLKIKSSGFAILVLGFRALGFLIIAFSLYNKIKITSLSEALSTFNFTYSSPDFWLIIGVFFLIISFIKNMLIPVIPAAFVEPDEKELKKTPIKKQLDVYAAGPFSNITTAFIFLLIFFLIAPPITNALVNYEGIEVTGFITINETKYPAELAGIQKGDIITSINNIPTLNIEQFTSALSNSAPGETVVIQTNNKAYVVNLAQHPEESNKSYLGVYVTQNSEIKPQLKKSLFFFPDLILWLVGLLYWLYLLSFGIGLFNLVPIGPIDGGRMLKALLEKYYEKKKAHRIFKSVSSIFLFLVLINLIFAFI